MHLARSSQLVIHVRPTSIQPQPACVRATPACSKGQRAKLQHRLVVSVSSESREDNMAPQIGKLSGEELSAFIQQRWERQLDGVDFREGCSSYQASLLHQRGRMERFVAELESSNWGVKADAVQVLASVMRSSSTDNSSWNNMVKTLKADTTIPLLLTMLRLHSTAPQRDQLDSEGALSQVQEPVTFLLSVLAIKHASAVAASGSIPVLVSMLGVDSERDMVRINAAKALQWMAVDSRASQDAIAKAGALSKLATMLECTETDAQVTAAETLCVIALGNEEVAQQLEADGVLHKLPASMRPDPVAPEYSQRHHAVVQPVGQPLDVEDWKQRLAHAVKKLNTSGVPAYLLLAAEICEMACQKDKLRALASYMAQSGVIAALLQALNRDEWQAKAAAVICLQSLANSYPGILSHVPAEQVPPWLVVLLKDQHGVTNKELMSLVVSQLKDVSLQYPAAVLNSGAVPLLLSLLDMGADRDCDSDSERNQEQYSNIDIMGVWKEKTKGGWHAGVAQASVRLDAVKAVRNLAQFSKEYQDAIVAAGAIPILKQYLLQTDVSLRVAAIEALGSLALHNKQVQEAMESDKVDDWDNYNHEASTVEELKMGYRDVDPAYQALSHLLMLWDMGDLPGTVSRPWQPGQHVYYVSGYQEDAVHDVDTAAAGAVDLLVRRLNATNGRSRTKSASCLRQMAEDSPLNQRAIVEAGAVPKLCTILDQAWMGNEDGWCNDSPRMQIAAAEALYALASGDKGIRDQMMADGSLTHIAEQYSAVSKTHRALSQALMAWGLNHVEQQGRKK